MLMHFVNNLVSATIGYLSSGTDASSALATADMTQVLASYLIIGFTAPILITVGMLLIDPKSHKKIRFLYAGILATVMLVAGIGINVAKLSNPIVNSTISFRVTNKDEELVGETFNVEEAKTYTVTSMITNGKGDYYLRIEGSDGTEVLSKTEYSGSLAKMVTAQIELKEGTYTTYITCGDGTMGQKPVFQTSIR